MRWDPQQYARYDDERGRPFTDLLARVGARAPRHVVDVGCGTGALTVQLAHRWPDALVEGIDSSAEMISGSAAPGVTLRVEDARDWAVPSDCDVIFSNAMLQWVPEHAELLRAWTSALPSGGWLAVQVPGNFDAPSHALMRSLAASARWRDRLAGVLRHRDAVASPAEYARLLLGAGLAADVWETTYLHVLTGADPVLQWVRGTGLRPVLAALTPADAAEFEAEYAAQMREAYPAGPNGTILPFRRIFLVGHKP